MCWPQHSAIVDSTVCIHPFQRTFDTRVGSGHKAVRVVVAGTGYHSHVAGDLILRNERACTAAIRGNALGNATEGVDIDPIDAAYRLQGGDDFA